MGGPLRCVARRTHWPRDSAGPWRDRASGEYGSASHGEATRPADGSIAAFSAMTNARKLLPTYVGPSRASLYHPAVALGRCNRPNPARRGISTNVRKYEILVQGPPTDRVQLQNPAMDLFEEPWRETREQVRLSCPNAASTACASRRICTNKARQRGKERSPGPGLRREQIPHVSCFRLF
jgi:hypothetical protein